VLVALQQDEQVPQKPQLIGLILNLEGDEFHGLGHGDRSVDLADLDSQQQSLDICLLVKEVANQKSSQLVLSSLDLPLFALSFGPIDRFQEVVQHQKQNRMRRLIDRLEYTLEKIV
jgi:hypothetical protein